MQRSVLLVSQGKRPRPVRIEELTGSFSSNLVFLKDSCSLKTFLVDSGAEVSVFPGTGPSSSASKSYLTTANGQPIISYGRKTFNLKFGDHQYSWSFIIADVSKPLLGAGFPATFRPPSRCQAKEATFCKRPLSSTWLQGSCTPTYILC